MDIPTNMKVLIKNTESEGYEFTEIPVPEPENGDLLIKVLKVGICGSDIALFKWNEVAKVIAKLPFIPGHECVGEIVKVGAECGPEYQVGKIVCAENHFYCGDCYQCKHDQKNICQNFAQYGHGKGTIHGACSQYSILPARYAYILKTDLDPVKACLLEPFGVAQHAIEELNPSGDTLLVQGCGAIGLLAIGMARACATVKIIALDIDEEKLNKAKKMGADILVNGLKQNLSEIVKQETSGDGIGCILEASGAARLLNSCFSLLRKGGRLVVVGLPKEPLHVENVLSDVVFKSLTLKTIHGRKIFSTWEKSEQLLYHNLIDVSCIVTHDLPMSQYEEAFKLLLSGDACKIMMDPQK